MSAPTATAPPFVPGQGLRIVPRPGAASQWHRFKMLGIDSPGTIPIGGFTGFGRKTGWDKQAGKGTRGATLILKTMPPAEGVFTCELITDEDFADWDSFVSRVLSIDPIKQKATGIPIYYPGLASVGVNMVVVEEYEPPRLIKGGKYHALIHLIEWNKPPAASVVQQPNSAGTDAPSPDVPLDPRIQAGQDDVAAALLAQAAAAGK